jgi:arylsulfatase A-like enzyme
MQQDGSFDRTTVVVFSDHGFRSGGRETNSRHVPFLVKRPGQASREDVADARAGEQLLMQVVQQGCPAQL